MKANNVKSLTSKFQYTSGGNETHITPCLLPDTRHEDGDQRYAKANGEEDVDSDIRIVAQRGELHGAEVADLLARLVRPVVRAVGAVARHCGRRVVELRNPSSYKQARIVLILKPSLRPSLRYVNPLPPKPGQVVLIKDVMARPATRKPGALLDPI